MSEHTHHIASAKLLLSVGAALFVLTILTTVVHYIHIPHPYAAIAAISIAVAKASLVVFVFMNLYWDTKFNFIVMATGIAFTVLLLALSMADVIFRTPVIPAF